MALSYIWSYLPIYNTNWGASAASNVALVFKEGELTPHAWLEDQLYRVRRKAWE